MARGRARPTKTITLRKSWDFHLPTFEKPSTFEKPEMTTFDLRTEAGKKPCWELSTCSVHPTNEGRFSCTVCA